MLIGCLAHVIEVSPTGWFSVKKCFYRGFTGFTCHHVWMNSAAVILQDLVTTS